MPAPPSNPSYLHSLSGDFINKTNVFRMVREFARYSNIDRGYYMEFGIMNGETAIQAYRQLRGIVTDVYGFDTFSGHPEHQEVDKTHAEYSRSSSRATTRHRASSSPRRSSRRRR